MDAQKPIRSKDMSLVKDMNNYRIVYYWNDLKGEQISPDLHSKSAAEEWRTEYLQTVYEGYQRRDSTVDRRLYEHKRSQHPRSANIESLFQVGRRSTDRGARVEQDLAAEKLESLFSLYETKDDNQEGRG